MNLSDESIEELYFLVQHFARKYLIPKGVKVPKLRHSNGRYVKNALTLVYLARNYPDTEAVSKQELTDFIRIFFPEVTDCQQGRHLGAQFGYNILSSERGEMKPPQGMKDCYKLVNLTQTHSYYDSSRRKNKLDSWEEILVEYDYCCATCGSEEGKPNRYNANAITSLQKAHRNPRLPLDQNNIIPQCSHCNGCLKDNWVFDATGKPYAIANPKVIHYSSEDTQYEVFKELANKFMIT